jgi:hypothetical protein
MLKKYAELIEDLAQDQDIKLMGHSRRIFSDVNGATIRKSRESCF